MTIRHITSLTHQSVKAMRALHMRKERQETQTFLCEGLKIITDAIEQGFAPQMLAFGANGQRHPLLNQAIDITLKASGEVFEVTSEILEKISRKDNPQMAVAVFAQHRLGLSHITPKSQKAWIGLEQIRDPGNLGTIIRTADAAGMGGVILIDDCVDPFGVECVRASMGSIFAVPIIMTRRDALINDRQRWTGSIIGTHLLASTDYRKADYTSPNLILMGTEQSGLSPELSAFCDKLVKIPMQGKADSLNLAIATALMIYKIADL